VKLRLGPPIQDMDIVLDRRCRGAVPHQQGDGLEIRPPDLICRQECHSESICILDQIQRFRVVAKDLSGDGTKMRGKTQQAQVRERVAKQVVMKIGH